MFFRKYFDARLLLSKSRSTKRKIPSPDWRGWREATGEGFTLAEVLITLGIIGIVAAMTLPAIIQKQNEKATIAQLKKAYSVLNSAMTLAVIDNGTTDNWPSTTSRAADYANILSKYFSGADNCKYDNRCKYDTNYRYLNGNKMPANEDYAVKTDSVRVRLKDGQLLIFHPHRDTNCLMEVSGRKDICAQFVIDINASKRPNQIGKDVFRFFITKSNIIADPSTDISQAGFGGALWILTYDNMEYLHCSGLSFNGEHSCKNKKMFSW